MSSTDGPDGETVSGERVFAGRVFSVRVDTMAGPDGTVMQREIVEHPGAVAIVPLVDADTVLMVTQYRHAVGEWLLEVPAGTIEEGEDPEWCAARELEEETGYVAGRLQRLFAVYTTPGFCNEIIHVFVADGLSPGQAHPDADEHIEVARVALADIPDMIRDGRIRDGKSVAALLALAHR